MKTNIKIMILFEEYRWKRKRKPFWVVVNVFIFDLIAITQAYTCEKIQWNEPLGFVHFTVFMLYVSILKVGRKGKRRGREKGREGEGGRTLYIAVTWWCDLQDMLSSKKLKLRTIFMTWHFYLRMETGRYQYLSKSNNWGINKKWINCSI